MGYPYGIGSEDKHAKSSCTFCHNYSLSFIAMVTATIIQGYSPVLYYPKKTSKDIYQILVAQCEKLNIPFLDSLPTAAEIDSQYAAVVDAIFGFSFKGDVRVPFDTILKTLREIKTPIASVDIPSGEFVMHREVDN